MNRRRGSFWRSPFTRITLYYLVAGGLLYALTFVFPVVLESFSGERLSELAQRGLTGGGGDPIGVSDRSMRGPVDSIVFAVLSMVGCLVLLAPVVWVYMVTRQRQGYDESVVHTVIILPIAVTALVIVVQDSVALAFSLAGIVAAVRFRNTLKDTKDAVYIFLAMGTAMAAGVQALGIAAVMTILFNYLVLIMWKLQIGNIYADQLSRAPKMRLGDVLAGAGMTPGAGSGNLTIGDPNALAALTPDSLTEIVERRQRLREHIASGGKVAKKYNGLLVVLASDTEECVDAIERVLEEATKQFQLAESTQSAEGELTLEFLIGLQKGGSGTDLITNLRHQVGQCIVAAEFRNLKLEK
jgi:hypothetical protein